MRVSDKKQAVRAILALAYRELDKNCWKKRYLLNLFNSGLILDSKKIVEGIKRYLKA